MEKKTATPATVKPVVVLSGAANIEKIIASIGNRGKLLDASIQQAAVSCIAHAEAHGDTTLMDKLYGAMPNGSRRNALAAYLAAFSLARIMDAKESKAAGGRVFALDRTKRTDMEGAQAVHWHAFKHVDGEAAQVFDVGAAFARLMARVQSAQASGVKLEGMDKLPQAALAVLGVAAPDEVAQDGVA